jgi:hypothetical protein
LLIPLDGVSISTVLWYICLWYVWALMCVAVCQKQIAVPNNSLLYCSEKCKREDALSSSPPLSQSPPPFHRSPSSSTLCSSFPSRLKMSHFEPSRKDQWGIPASPVHVDPLPVPFAGDSAPPSTGTSPTYSSSSRPMVFRTVTGSNRPLPPLHPRALGSSPRTMELVMPVYKDSCPSPGEGGKSLDYGRRIIEGNTPSQGGLKKLFHFAPL